MAKIFADDDWDTVSVFTAGDPTQVMNDLGVYSEFSDGIVFSKEGKPFKEHLSTYGFPEDVPPLISYYLASDKPNPLHYVSMPRTQAIVHAKKYRFHDGSWKYNIVAGEIS